MTNYKKVNGKYKVNGKLYESVVGSRRQVWNETSYKTSGGLTKSDLLLNKSGRIVSKSKHNSEKKSKRLIKHGYGSKKGQFGYVLIGEKGEKKSKTKKNKKSWSIF